MTGKAEFSIYFLRLPQVKQLTGLSRSSIYAKIQNGDFPSPINLGGRAVAWIDHEVEDWIRERVAATRGGAQ
jgi:prophage regulatory protein